MRIYIRDQNDAVLDVLDDTYYDLSIEDFLKGKATVLSFSMVKDEMSYKLITTGKNLSFIYDDEEYWLTCMIVEQDEYYLSVTAWSIGLEYNNETIGPYKAPKAMTFVEYLNVIDFEKVLTIGINEVSDKKISYEWTGTDKKLARLYSLANVFGAEIAFVTRLNDDGSLKQIVINVYHKHDDTYQGLGNDRRNETFYFGEEIKTIKKTEDKTGLYTAIIATGKDGLTIASIDREVKDEDGLVLYKTVSKATTDFPDVTKIYAVQARLQFPSTVKGSDRWTVNNAGETEYSSAEALYGYMLSQLKANSVPKVTWEIEGNIKAKIGDTVRIADEGYKPTLYLEARVTGKVRKPDNLAEEKTTFSNVKELESEVDQSLLDRVNALIEQTKPYTLSLVSDNGVTFKNSEGETTLSAIVYNGTQVITPDVTVRWYKDDVWVKTGYTLEVQASNINAKAVYKAIVIDTNGKERATQDVTVFNVDDGKFGDLTDDEKKEIASHGEQFIAYAWSPDGTDRFTRVKPEPTQDELAKDYDNAVPRYIGRSLKDSTNPSDFTWEPNPERKPWTSYAQGLNGEGFSLMPYGENLLTGTSSELSTDKTLSFIIKYGWSKAVKFVDKKITLQAYIENAPYDLRVQFWNNSRPLFGNIVPKGTSGISSVTGTVPSSATDGNITMAFVNQGTLTEPAVLPYSKLKLELANTMNIPTPWTPAPSEDPLGAIPKYVGTAALPYDDWTKYTYTMNPEWADLNATLGLNTKVDNGQYQEDKNQIFEDIANRLTKEEAAEINTIAQKALDMITAYTDPDSGKAAADLNALEQRIVGMVNELGAKIARWNFIDTWMTAGEEGFSIANAKSTTKFLVKNNRMSFINSGEEVAYFSGQSFMIQRGIVTQGMQIGSHKEEALNKDHTVTRWIAT